MLCVVSAYLSAEWDVEWRTAVLALSTSHVIQTFQRTRTQEAEGFERQATMRGRLRRRDEKEIGVTHPTSPITSEVVDPTGTNDVLGPTSGHVPARRYCIPNLPKEER
jgi:hypothetical protein